MSTQISLMENDEDLLACFAVFKELRPHLEPQFFLAQIRRQQVQGYQVIGLRYNEQVKSIAGFRLIENLAWGQVLYVDDLVTLSAERSNGYAGKLLDWLKAYGKIHQCKSLHLDTGYARHHAHAFYLNKGFQLSCHHLALALSS